MKKASLYTLGCRLNHTESSILARNLENVGYTISEKQKEADLCIINTCTVTNQSDSKCRQLIRSVQLNNPSALIAVIGCFSQVASQQILEIGGVDIILGNEDKLNLHKFLKHFKSSNKPLVSVGKISKTPFSIDTFALPLGATRANLKIQDGCNFTCSFCIIPFARGRSRSRQLNNIKAETEELVEKGIKEIILTGVNIGTYQYKNAGFINLLEMFEKIDGLKRVRISSIEPTTIDADVISLMADPESKLVPYLHLPLQSAANPILLSMKRRYLINEYRELIEQAFERVPNICIGSDVIVGFPGEREEDFEETFTTLKTLPVNYFHVFPYAGREGTRSIKLDNQVDQKIINRRAAILRGLSQQKKGDFTQQFVGKNLNVLFENNQDDNQWSGYSDNYIRVSVSHKNSLRNKIKTVKILSQSSGLAQGELLE